MQIANIRQLRAAAGMFVGVAAPLVLCPALGSVKDDARNRKIAYDYARCVVRKNHKRAADMLLADDNNSTILRHYADLIDSDCLTAAAPNSDMTFGGDQYRYSLADALVSSDFETRGPTDFSDRLPLAHLEMPSEARLSAELVAARNQRQRDDLQAQYNKAMSVALLSRYGECVVRPKPAEARLWLLTPPDTPEETSRINALRPAFEACLGGGTVQFSRSTMRGTVAINYYRLAMATPHPVAGKPN